MKSLIAILFALSNYAFSSPELVNVGLDRAFIPIGFDDNDRVELIVAGMFPDTCHQLGPYDVEVNSIRNEIYIYQKAYFHPKFCSEVLNPFHKIIELEMIREGNYSVWDAYSQKQLGNLVVSQSKNAGPDDFHYLDVADLIFEKGKCNNVSGVFIEGSLPNRCSKFSHFDIRYQEDVIIILPILKKLNARHCGREAKDINFRKEVPLMSFLPNNYLFHVRSRGGKSLNKFYPFSQNRCE